MLSRPSNLQLLEDHPGELDPDGIHFNIMSSINFVQDLHDQAIQLALKAPPDVQDRLVPIFMCHAYVIIILRSSGGLEFGSI